MRSGTLAEMIVVMPNGRCQVLGGYCLDSPVTGGWATFIKAELVGWVDSTYRTFARRESRAVVGLSMGGFGAIQMGIRASDVFSVVDAMSPCCLDFVEDAGYGNIAGWRSALTIRSLADSPGGARARCALARGPVRLQRRDTAQPESTAAVGRMAGAGTRRRVASQPVWDR